MPTKPGTPSNKPADFARNTDGTFRVPDRILSQRDALRLERADVAVQCVYNRMSSRNQAGRGKAKLKKMTTSVTHDVQQATQRVVLKVFYGVEEGKPGSDRPAFDDLIAWANTWAADTDKKILIWVRELSRILRAKEFHKQRNREAWPTTEEFDDLIGRFHPNVFFATLIRPTASESEMEVLRRKWLAEHGYKGGRPRSPIWNNHELIKLIFSLLGEIEEPEWSLNKPGASARPALRWQRSLSTVAKWLAENASKRGLPPMSAKAARALILRLLDSPVPNAYRRGTTWKEMNRPGGRPIWWHYERCMELGLLE